MLLVHFGYHRCMTSFFDQVFGDIANRYGGFHRHYNEDLEKFYEASKADFAFNHISVNNVAVDFRMLPDLKGTHIIRDPRDLLVSGYSYHLWCGERWTREEMDDKLRQRLKLDGLGIQAGSYQELLNSVDTETGLLLELSWRDAHFRQMLGWDYSKKNILELRYEEMFGNEEKQFRKILKHLGFSAMHAEKLLGIVEKHKFGTLARKKRTGQGKHAAYGRPGQWRSLPAKVKGLFNRRYPELLEKLGYD